jgi:hypothetical protein
MASDKPNRVTAKFGDAKAKQPNHGITKLEAVSARERIFVVNGVKFFAGVVQSTGYRILSAAHESKKTLISASAVLEQQGWETKVAKSKDDPSLYLLTAKERKPSGPWPDEDQPSQSVIIKPS